MIKVVEDITKIRRDNLRLITLRYKSGLDHKGAMMKASANLADAEFEMDQTRCALETAQWQLTKAMGRRAFFTLDAFPETRVDSTVEHIYYESKTVNNVTIYEVDLNPGAAPPDFIRSGMNASVNFITDSKDDVLYLPSEAVMMSKGERYVLVKNGRKPVERPIETGISGEGKIELVSGINDDDTILVKSKKFVLPQGDKGSNPFMPFGKKKELPDLSGGVGVAAFRLR